MNYYVTHNKNKEHCKHRIVKLIDRSTATTLIARYNFMEEYKRNIISSIQYSRIKGG